MVHKQQRQAAESQTDCLQQLAVPFAIPSLCSNQTLCRFFSPRLALLLFIFIFSSGFNGETLDKLYFSGYKVGIFEFCPYSLSVGMLYSTQHLCFFSLKGDNQITLHIIIILISPKQCKQLMLNTSCGWNDISRHSFPLINICLYLGRNLNC